MIASMMLCISEVAGEALAVPGRCLAFPNTVQHRVAPFRLEDETMPGHRRLLAFFLVDPALPIVSTQEVAPRATASTAWMLIFSCSDFALMTLTFLC